MAEKSEVLAEIIVNPKFTTRVRAVCAAKAFAILGEAVPNAGQLAWAKLAVANGYDAWVEALLILVSTQPATTAAAYDALDAAYATALDGVLPEVILAKGL